MNHQWKYNEEEILNTLKSYISGTYNQHYTTPESDIQTIDLIHANGDSVPFCKSSAIKYISRLGKKSATTPKMDLLKAMHFCVLAYHFAGYDKPAEENINNRF
jgi:hypothetical protein